MPNAVDATIDQITQQHTHECERLNVSRNVQETKRRVAEALRDFSKLDIVASGYWEGLGDAAKIAAIRDAVVELAAGKKPAPKAEAEADEPAEDAEPAPAKKPRKAKVAVA